MEGTERFGFTDWSICISNSCWRPIDGGLERYGLSTCDEASFVTDNNIRKRRSLDRHQVEQKGSNLHHHYLHRLLEIPTYPAHCSPALLTVSPRILKPGQTPHSQASPRKALGTRLREKDTVASLGIPVFLHTRSLPTLTVTATYCPASFPFSFRMSDKR